MNIIRKLENKDYSRDFVVFEEGSSSDYIEKILKEKYPDTWNDVGIAIKNLHYWSFGQLQESRKVNKEFNDSIIFGELKSMEDDKGGIR